jgi:hypothetical protein
MWDGERRDDVPNPYTFLSHTPQEAFADRIGLWRMNGRFENLNRTRCRHPSKTWSKFAIMIMNQILRCLPIWRGFSEVLRYPRIDRRSCHSYVDHPPRLEFYDEERKERSKEEICDLQEVTSPDLCGVMVQKGCPPLSSGLVSANSPHVLLKGSLAYRNTQFQEFPTNPLSAPQPILRRHFSDQCDGFRGYLGL